MFVACCDDERQLVDMRLSNTSQLITLWMENLLEELRSQSCYNTGWVWYCLEVTWLLASPRPLEQHVYRALPKCWSSPSSCHCISPNSTDIGMEMNILKTFNIKI